MAQLESFSTKEYFRENFPDTAILIHLILFGLFSAIFIPLLTFTDRLSAYGHIFKSILGIYGCFLLVMIIFHSLNGLNYNRKRNNLIQQNSDRNIKIIRSRPIVFNSIEGRNSWIYGQPLVIGNWSGSTVLGFDKADVVKIDDSLIVYGKGNLGVVGKGIVHPFEISFKNEFITSLNHVKAINSEFKEGDLVLACEANSLDGSVKFTFTIKGYNK